MDTPMRYPKYPSTPHLPWSQSKSSDDKTATKRALLNLQSGMPLVVSEKLDGNNVTLTRNKFYGRSVSSTNNPWDSAARSRWVEIAHDIPEGWRISAENMLARRSIAYNLLPDVILVFGIWDETNTLIKWSETEEWCKLLGLITVPVIYKGNGFEEAISTWASRYAPSRSEGYVIRNAERIPYDEFKYNVAKMVRENHLQPESDFDRRDDFERNGFQKRTTS